MNEQEVRAAAVQAAATCYTKVGVNDPQTLLDVAEMMEAYIQKGGNAAREVIHSWNVSAPASIPDQPQGGASPQVPRAASEGDSPTDPRAQELADEAYLTKDRVEVEQIIRTAEGESLEEVRISICGKEGSLRQYLNSRWIALKPVTSRARSSNTVPLYERNKKDASPPSVSAIRSDLGL